MRNDKEQALKLRIQGYSYSEINKKLGIPKSTLSVWLSKVQLSKKAQNRIANRVYDKSVRALIKYNKSQTHKAVQRASEIQSKASIKITNLSNYQLLLVGTALYWGEGYKRPVTRDGREKTWHMISFANSDPEMVYVFIEFLIKILNVPKSKIRLVLVIHPYVNEKDAKEYWSNATGLDGNSFYKVSHAVSIASKRKKPYNTLPHGTIQVRVYDTKKFHELMGYISGLKKNYMLG